jgi:hypothetical protein
MVPGQIRLELAGAPRVTLAGVKEQLKLVVERVHDRLTVPVNPLMPVTVIVE